jgi:hypothetical protein
MRAILPRGYSIAMWRKRLTEQLHKARADELATATKSERRHIEREIQAEVNRQFPTVGGTITEMTHVLWMR